MILFDLDGTLTDPKEGITKSAQYALRHFDIFVEADDLCGFIGPPLRTSFKEFFNFSDEDAEKAAEKYRERYAEKGMFENKMYDGIDALLAELKSSGKILSVATLKATVFAKKILAHFDIEKYFSFVSGAELCGKRSEKNEVIEYALKKTGVTNLSECIMVGDRKYDILGAKAIGIKSVGVLYGYGDAEELTNAGADFIVENVNGLSDLLKKNLGG